MYQSFFALMEIIENSLWGYIGVPIIIGLGLFLSFKSNFFQVRSFPTVIKSFISCITISKQKTKGIHPLKAFFACVGGCVGVGNIVGICTAIQIGGPGALFWIWITAILGAGVKYAEVYLGVKYRVENQEGGFNGGPMYFLQRVTSKKWVPLLVCGLLCIYGVEVYQFSVVTESVTSNFDLDRYLVAIVLVSLVAFAGSGGVKRVGSISSAIIPLFVVLYMGMGMWVLIQNYMYLPGVFKEVFASAFSQTSAVGGFVGSTLMLTVSQGVRRGCYTADVGVGYASVIHSESALESPEKQASLVIFDVFIDTFLICTMSVLQILVSGIWTEPMEAGLLVQKSLSVYFPFIEYFMPFFLFLLGYSTITAYFCVGVKAAEFLSKKNGKKFFYAYAVVALSLSAFVDTTQAQTIMAIAGGLLLTINCWGIYRLRHDISFAIEEAKQTPVRIPLEA
jgi:AGCS family alanine or glycine:cation symporter